ncbi:MAG TPA: hypothetical protein VF486_20345 [Actinomycetes bacterium]
MRRLLAALAVAVGISLLGVPAAQASHPRSQIVVAPRNTYAGQIVLVSGSCMRTGAVARIEIDRHPWAVTVTRSAGHFRFAKRLPTTLRSRSHLMYLFCNGRFRALAGFRVWPRSHASFAVAPTTTGRSHAIRIQGSGCLPSTIVYFRIDVHRLIGHTVARANWFFRGGATIPSNIAFGTHSVSAQCRQTGRVVGSRTVNVVEYPGLEASLGGMRVDRSTVVAGRTIAFSARSCEYGVTDAALDNRSVQLAAPDRRGGIFRAKATIPSGTPAGVHQLVTRCDGDVSGTATVQVVATNAVASGASSSLPERRSNIVPGVSLGLALIVTGALVLTSISRRRRGAVRP